MTNPEEKSVEQLWYTSSDVGLGSIDVGFRMRAVSPNLTMIYGERVRGMDRYTRYTLPRGTDPAISPSIAPICLTFAYTGWNNEAIVVQKKYIGLESNGRQGNFFSHLFGLGAADYKDFSARDAVRLWRANIWQDNDQSLADRRNTTLPQETLAYLLQAGQQFKSDYQSVGQYLPFFIEAYLTRKQNEPLYVAAPTDFLDIMIYLLDGLTSSLPRSLYKDLTFSTFEADITKATTQIIGTSWISSQPAPQIFTPQFYRDKLALNCATGERSNLTNHPRVTNHPLANQFAQYVTNCLVSNSIEQLNALLAQAENYEGLSVENFLHLYHDEISNYGNFSPERIETSLLDSTLRVGKLSNSAFRAAILQFVLADPQWFETKLKPLLAGMLPPRAPERLGRPTTWLGLVRPNRSEQLQDMSDPALVKALPLLAEDAAAKMLQIMEKINTGTSNNADIQARDGEIVMLLDLMEMCLLPHDPHHVWQNLFAKVHPSTRAVAYLTAPVHQNILFRLFTHWNEPANDVSIGPLLVFPWESLGEFLRLHLREPNGAWNVIALDGLIQRLPFTPQIARSLGQYHPEITQLFTQLTSQQASLPIAGILALLLLQDGYPGKLDYTKLLSLLVENKAFEAAKDLAIALIQSGYKANNAHKQQVGTLLHNLLQTGQGLDLFDMVVGSGYFQKKDLANLLLNSVASQRDPEGVIRRVYQTRAELAAFFVNDGKNYLASKEQQQAMLKLFVGLSAEPGKWERLEVLLNASQDQTYVREVLRNAALTQDEMLNLIKTYGKRYLQNEQQAPEIAQDVVRICKRLAQTSFSSKKEILLALFTPDVSPQQRETVLQAVQLSSPDEINEFLNTYTASDYRSLLYTSPIALELFRKLAELSNRGNMRSEEKMKVLFAWLQPTWQQAFVEADVVEKLIQIAALTRAEQRQFLEAYGSRYLNTFQKKMPPIVLNYIKDYINNHLRFADLDRLTSEQATFFTYLCQGYQSLPLDADTKALMGVYSSIANLDISQDELDKLVGALTILRLSDYSVLIKKLAQVFVQHVRNVDQLTQVMQKMKQVESKISGEQLLFTMAEHLTQPKWQTPDENRLAPYLIFALTKAPNEQDPFTIKFLKELLSQYNETNFDAWRRLNTIVMEQTLSPSAIAVWRSYLRKAQLFESVVVQLVAPFGANSTSIPPEAKHTLLETLMRTALLFKYINFIAFIWERFVSSSASLHEFEAGQKEQIAIAVCFVQLCEFHDRSPITSPTSEFGRESIEWVQKMEQYGLKPASKQEGLYTLAKQWLRGNNVSLQNLSGGVSQGNAQNNSTQTP